MVCELYTYVTFVLIVAFFAFHYAIYISYHNGREGLPIFIFYGIFICYQSCNIMLYVLMYDFSSIFQVFA